MMLYLHIKSLSSFAPASVHSVCYEPLEVNLQVSHNESGMMSDTLWRFIIALWHILVLQFHRRFLFRADAITQLQTQTTRGLCAFLKSITSKSADCWAANTMLSQKSLLWAGRCFASALSIIPAHKCFLTDSPSLVSFPLSSSASSPRVCPLYTEPNLSLSQPTDYLSSRY